MLILAYQNISSLSLLRKKKVYVVF